MKIIKAELSAVLRAVNIKNRIKYVARRKQVFGKIRSLIFKKLSRKKHAVDDSLKETLKRFISSIYHGQNLGQIEAKRNVEESLVEIVHLNGQHAANAIQIDESGIYLTCYHCVDKKLDSLRLFLDDSSFVKGIEILSFCEKRDLALIKGPATKNRRTKVFKYSQLSSGLMWKEIPVVMLSVWDGELTVKGGFIFNNEINRSSNGENCISQLRCSAVHGDSGSIVLTHKGEFVGIMTSSNLCDKGCCIPWFQAFDFIANYVYQ